jgi:peptidoglycan glycosyltransferase
VNKPIIRIYMLVLVLFASLVYFTSKWAVFDAEELEAKDQNRRPLIEAQQIPRGSITTADGVLVAESNPEGGGRRPVYVRTYPEGPLFGHPVGFSYVEIGNSGIEESENDLLTGEENEFASILDQLRDQVSEGADITLTIDSQLQRIATEGLQSAIASNALPEFGTGGAAVALDPSTGAVLAMASSPGYDPNTIDQPGESERLNTDEDAPLINRPTQAIYPPGSTMKVVTAAAALDSGEFEPDTVLNADSPKEISGIDLANSGGASFGDIEMTTALTNSVNTYWAQVGEQLGTETMVEYMERFGFYAVPELDYPDSAMEESGVYSGGSLVRSDFDVGRVAIGQGGAEGQMLASATQMAEVAATVANGGKLMEPTFLLEAKDPDGRVLEELGDGDEQSQVISEESAAQLNEMMTSVTREGTAAALDVSGVEFAGKTGTAERDVESSLNQPWFIGFAPSQDPQVAVAVTIESCTGCFGGEVAGPIATDLMEAVLAGQ